MLTLTELPPRDCPSGVPVEYPRADYLAASARFAAYDLPGPRGDAVTIPAWPAVVEIPVAPDPATPNADTTDALAALQSIPRRERVALAGRGVSVRAFDGPVTALPQFAYLAGRDPGLVGYGGSTYADAVGLADPLTRAAYVRAGASPHFTLHEVGHLAEFALLSPARESDYESRVYPALRDFYGADTYFGANPREAFAESLARRWEGEAVPAAALDFYDSVFHGVEV